MKKMVECQIQRIPSELDYLDTFLSGCRSRQGRSRSGAESNWGECGPLVLPCSLWHLYATNHAIVECLFQYTEDWVLEALYYGFVLS